MPFKLEKWWSEHITKLVEQEPFIDHVGRVQGAKLKDKWPIIKAYNCTHSGNSPEQVIGIPTTDFVNNLKQQ